MKIGISFLVFLCSISFILAQDRNFHSTIGLGISSSLPLGVFSSKNTLNAKSAYASNEYDGFKFTFEQNVASHLGISLSVYSMSYKFDINNFEKSLTIDNRGLSSDQNLIYQIHDTIAEWDVTTQNVGAYYYRFLGTKKKFLVNIEGSLCLTQIMSPKFTIEIKDSSNSILETRTIDKVRSWREPFFLSSPFDGFSLEINARYFFTKHFSLNTSAYYVYSPCYFEGKQKALINLSKVNYQAFNFTLGLNYTILYKRRKQPTITS